MYWNQQAFFYTSFLFRLIETWDVLKSEREVKIAPEPSPINRNMRCIEISSACYAHEAMKRLIETWDVLK